jgi:hypothetical protein
LKQFASASAIRCANPDRPSDLQNTHVYRRLHRTSAELGAATVARRKPCVDALAYHAALSEDAAHARLLDRRLHRRDLLICQVNGSTEHIEVHGLDEERPRRRMPSGMTLNQRVQGLSPCAPTSKINQQLTAILI